MMGKCKETQVTTLVNGGAGGWLTEGGEGGRGRQAEVKETLVFYSLTATLK